MQITTFVNGLAPPFAGEETFQHVKEFVDEVVLVSDAEIEASLAKLYYEFHLVVEVSIPCNGELGCRERL